MKKVLLSFILFFSIISLNAQITPTSGIVYVKQTGTGTANGSSWTNATSNLQAAIDAAGTTQVWVAAGTYQLANGVSYKMKNDVAIYGGFAGTESALSARDWKNNSSILKGNGASVVKNSFIRGAPLFSSAVLDGFTITGGLADDGGGIYNAYASPTIKNVIIRNNSGDYGGGMYNAASSSPTITNVMINGNIATTIGGAIYNNSSAPNLINVTMIGNVANNGSGSGIVNVSGAHSTLINVTMSGNKSTVGGVIANAAYSSATIRNSIIYGNSGGIINSSNSNSKISYSLLQGSGSSSAWVNSTGTDEGNNTEVDPQFTTAPNFTTAPFTGGDYALKLGSPAINAGDNTLNTTTLDLAGNTRIKKGAIDLGAYESDFYTAPKPDANGVVYVKTSTEGTGDGKSWANATANLQEAIDATGVTQVWVAGGTYQLATNNSYKMRNGVAIYGGFAGSELSLTTRNWATNITTLQGNNASVIRNDFTSADPLNTTAILDGFTITGGHTKGSDGATYGFGSQYAGGSAEGGGIYNVNASPTLINLSIIGNKVIGGRTGGWGLGGGMYNKNSSPQVTNVIISGNRVDGGGGSINNPMPGIGHGGGLYNDNSSPLLTNVTISSNYASTTAGGLFNNNSSAPIIRNTVIYGNNTGITNANSSTPVISFSLIQNLTDATSGNISSAGITAAQIFISPQVAGLSTVGDYTLKAGSPAINVGDSNLNTAAADLVGKTRVQKGEIDMGAYESAYYPAPKPDASGIVYVKTATSGTGDGKSWANATANLQEAIDATGVTQVWVAGGTYQLATNISYKMKNGVAIYGGFAGSETALNGRNWATNVTTLKGDGTASVIRNAFTSALPLTASALLNGFTISGGLATEDIDGAKDGGGFYNFNASPTLTNLTIKNNVAGRNGGGLYNYESSPTLTNVAVYGNKAGVGAGVFNDLSSPTLINVTISGNKNNFFGNGGAGLHNYASSPIISNSIVWGNSKEITNGFNSFPVISYSLLNGSGGSTAWVATNGTDGGNNIDADPLFKSAPSSNTAPFSLGDYSLKSNSPAINTGNNTDNTTTKDLAGNTRMFDGKIDMGAYENQFATTLPVQLLSFVANAQNQMANLKWTIASQQNNAAFLLSRSTDGLNFVTLATIIAHGTTDVAQQYAYNDYTPLKGNNYYRLQQVDYDGAITDLGEKILNFTLSSKTLKIYPNPTIAVSTLQFEGGKYNKVIVWDISGRLLQQFDLGTTDTTLNIDFSRYPSSTYFIEVKGKADKEIAKVYKK